MFDDFSELSKQYGLGGNDDDDSGKIATPPIPSASSSVSSDDDYEALSKAYGLGVFSPASPTSTSTSKRGKRNRANPGGLTDAELAQAIAQGAKSLGVSPEDYATAIAYETGGTFDPWQAGPTTKWGQHRGTIQYGEPQRKQFGVYQGQGFADQVTGSNVRYLKQRGVRPGATFREIYAAINGGNAKKNLKTFDANTGRTIADNIANANRQWRGIVQNRFGQYWNTGNNSNVSAAADNTDYDSLLARFVPDNTDYAALGEQYAPSASPTTNATDLIAGAADKNGQGIRQSGSSAQTPILPSAQPASSPASPAVSTPSPTFAAPYADTSIASGALTDNKGAASNGAINKSVQEAPDTILAQKDSALANDTQRAAVLTTAPELEDQFFTGDADKGMWTPVKVSQGTLWVNNAKARKLKLRSPEDIAMFVERNPDAMARLIGKVENVGDATEVGQPTVVTTAPDGTELSASAVTSPMAAELQVNLDNLNFPQGTSKITDGSDVVAKRQAATGQQSNTVPANTAQSNSAPATPPKSPAQQAFDLGVDWVKGLKKAQANPAKIEQDTESETAPAASNSGSGSVKVELDPSDFKVDGKSITDAEAFERGQEVDGGGVFFVPKRVGAANATLDKAAVAGRFRPPQGLTAEDAARRAFLLAGQRYGATDANWQAYKATEAGQNFLKGLNGVVPDRIDVTYNALAGGGLNAKGDRRMEETISANEIANANAAPRQTYTAPPKGVMEVFGEELDKTLGDRDERGNLTPENEAKKAAYNSPSYDDYIESAFQAMRNMPASPVTPSSTIGNEAIARGAGGLATSTSQVLSGLYDSSIFGWTDAGVKKGLSAIFGEDAVKQAAPDIAATLGKFGNSVERVAPKGTPDDEYGVTRFVGDVSDGIGRLPVYVGVGAATGGNPILTFAVVDAASARGKGGTLGETLTAGAKGAAMGAAFSGVSRLANSFTDGIFDGSLKNFLKGKLNIPSVYQAPVEATADQVAKETAARQIGAMLNTIERSSTPAGERLAAQKAVERLLTKHNTTVEDVLSGKLTGKVAQDVADAASKENANLLGRYLTKTGINVGLVSGMGYGIAAASGDEHPGRNALLFGAMELLGSLMHIPPKTAREFTPAEIRKVDNTVLRLPSETGQPRDVIVRATPDGKALTVTDVTGRVPDSAITAAMGGKAITKNPAGAGKPLIEPPAIEKPTGVPLPKMPEVELPTESNVKTENAAIKEKQETGKELETTSPISEPTALVGKNEVLPDAETAASKGAVEEVKQGETDRAEKAERVGRLTVTAPRTRVGRLDITPAKKAEAEAAVEPVEAKVESVETAEPASVKPYDLTPEAYKEAFPLEKDGQSITAENGKTYELHQGTGDKWWVQEPKTKEIKNFNSRGQMRRFLYGHSSHAQAIEAAIKNGESVDAKILAKYPRLEQKAQKAAGDRIFKFQADETAAPIFGEIAAKGLGAVDKAQLASLQGIGEKYHVTPKEVNRLVGASDLAFRRRSAKGKQGQYEDGSRLPSGKVAEALSQIDDVVPRSFVERSHDLWGNDWYVSNKPIARYEETGARRVTQSEYKKNEQAWEASPEGRRWKEYLESKKPPIKSEKSVSPFDTPEGRERMAKERIKALAEEHGVSEQDISAMESAGVLFSTRRDITPEQIIETATDIEKRLIAAGYDARLTRANTTNTRYVTVYEDGYDPIVKIRVSDHDEGALRSNPLNYYGGDNVSDVVQAVKDYKEQSDQDAIKFRAKQDAMRAEIERRRAEKARRSEQTDKPLFQRKTDAADRLLHDELPFETDFNKVAKGLKGGTFHKDTGELELKPHDAETARRLLNNVHSIRHGIEVNNPSFDGVVLDAGTLRAMAKEALGAAVDMDKTGYAKSQVDAMNALAKNLNAVATHAKDFGIAYVFDSALPEERVHQDDLRAGRTDAQAIKELKENELWDASPKFDRDYEGISSQDKASEIAAKLATGQEVEYGWNKLPNFRELRRKFLETWLDGIARANKETIDAIGIDTFFDRFTRLKEIRDEIKTDTKERGTQSIEPPSEAVGGESGVYGRGESGQGEVGEQGRGARAETSRVGGTAEGRAARDNSAAETPIDIPTERLPEMPKVELPNDKAEKTTPVESTVKEPTVKEPALAADKPETASTPTTEESGAQKERKTILSAEKWGEVEKDAITGAPRYYRVKSQKPAIAKAQTEIDRIGLDRSFVRALEPLDNVKQEDFAATNIFRREVYYLLGELADKNKGTPAGVAFKEQQEAVLSAMAETGTAGGQLVQSFDPIDRRDARTAVEFTNRQRRKQGWDEPLTEKESEQLKEYAKTLAIQQEALEIAKREIEELKTKAAVGGGGARSSLTGRQKKFITDLRAASDAAIARLHLDEIAPMLSRGTGKRIPNAPLMSRRTPRPSDDELDALADIGANILFDGFQDTDIITQEAFNKRIQEIAGTRYDDHLDLIHAVSMKRLSEMRTEARRQAAIDRVKDANPNATDAEIDKAIADHAKELAERSKARAKHRKTANKVLKAEGIFTEKQKAAYEAKLARQDAKAAQKAQDAVIAAKADADRFLETAVELGYGGTANEDALALALHLYRGDARGETPIGEKEAIKFLQELRPDLKYRLGETGKESHDRVFETAKVVAEADKIRNAVKARYKAERQAALSALTEKQAAMRERRAAVVKASNEYHNLQRAFATVPPSLRNKIKQTTLMAMVSAFNTAANNGLGGIGTRALYRVVDLTEVGLQRVVKKLFPKFTFAEIAGALPPETKFKDIFGIPTGEDAGFTAYFKDMLGSNALMAQVLSEHPELYRKLFSGHSADIKTYKEIGTGTAPTDRFYRRTSAYRAAHHAADAGIWLYDKLNVFNRLQEYGVRGLEAPYFLQLLAGARGENVRDLVKKGEIGSFTEAELAAAVERALRVTFALSPQKGTTAYKVLDRINKYPMASMVFAPFARFGWNVWSMGRDWLPGVAAFRAAKRVATAENAVWRDITNPSKYTAREAANNIAGLVFFATMFGVVRALGDRDDWYYLRVPGTDKFIDVRQHPEIAPFVYLANKFNRFINGQDLFNYDDTASIANELLEVFFGYSYRQAVDQNSLLRIAPKLLKGKGEEAYNLLSQFIGERVGLFFSPARPLKNFTDSLSRTGDLDLDDSPFTEGLSRQLPKMIFEAAGAPPRTKLGTKDEPKRYSKYAYLKPFGLNIVDGETAEPQTSQTVRGLKKSVYDDGKPYEAPILAADKRERNAKREIYALVNKAEASLPKDADNEAKQVAYAPVRAALKDAVGRNWLTQKQADYIDSRLGKTQAAQLAARASISDALTAYETALKDKLVSQREREEITEAIKKKLTTGKGTITARDIQRAEKLGFTVSPMVRQRAKEAWER